MLAKRVTVVGDGLLHVQVEPGVVAGVGVGVVEALGAPQVVLGLLEVVVLDGAEAARVDLVAQELDVLVRGARAHS